MNSLEKLREKIVACERCDLRRLGSKPVLGDGSVDAQLIFVGEAPNTQSERDGKPFLGWTGRALEQWLEYLGISRSQIHVTNAVKCVLRENSGVVDRSGYWPATNGLTKKFI